MWRIGMFAAVAILVAACSAGVGSPAPGTGSSPMSTSAGPSGGPSASYPPSPAPSPSPTPAPGFSSSPSPAASAAPAASAVPAADYAGFHREFCAAWAELFTTIGNPDTGSGSALSEAFDAALRDGDVVTARAKAPAIIAGLESGRRHIAAGALWPTGAPMMAQMDRLFAAFQASYAAQRDAADRGAQEAKRLGQEALEAAGGLDAWYAIIRPGTLDETRQAISSARPADVSGQCEGLPIGL